MRESRTFGERARIRQSDELKRKYFLVFEGSETEPLYFSAINEARTSLGISPLIDLIQIERCRGEEGWSNPKKIIDMLSINLDERHGDKLSYSTLLNAIIDCLYYDAYIKKKGNIINEIWDLISKKCAEDLKIKLNDIVEERNATIELLIKEISINRLKISELILSNLANSLNNLQITYDPAIDTICLIIDRDRKSFFGDQYTYVIEKCTARNIIPYVSNPSFEFWLLLHFDIVNTLDKNQLLENSKISHAKHANNYVAHELKKALGGYKKRSYDTDTLIKNIDTAIVNEKNYCESIHDLENQLGTNIGLLITEMRNQK